MVQSILNTNVNYPEIKKLDPEDNDYDASMYEINILGIDIVTQRSSKIFFHR